MVDGRQFVRKGRLAIDNLKFSIIMISILSDDLPALSPTPTQVSDAKLLTQFSLMYRNAVDAFMDKEGMHRGQALVLCAVVGRGGLTQTELAEELSVTGPTVTHMLQRLEEARLITRRRDDADNRLVRVHATEAGRELELSLTRQLAKLEDVVLAGMNAGERETLRELVRRMIANMEATA